MSPEKIVKVAAIQMCAELAAVSKNLEKAENLIRLANKKGAQWVVLPEFFTSACAFHPTMHEAILPVNGKATQLLSDLASELNIYVGGSFLAQYEHDVFNTFVLAEPNGETLTHNKDIPTMWENCYYIGGEDSGVLKTTNHSVGVALCWEMLRTQTARRLIGEIEFVLSGSCWWNLPESAPAKFDALRNKSLNLLKSAPVTFAKLMGTPVIHAGHAGNFQGFAPPDDEKPYSSHYMGETMIVDGDGLILASMSREDGEGVVVAEINLANRCTPSMEIADQYWVAEMPKAFLAEYEKLNIFGQNYYHKHTRASA